MKKLKYEICNKLYIYSIDMDCITIQLSAKSCFPFRGIVKVYFAHGPSPQKTTLCDLNSNRSRLIGKFDDISFSGQQKSRLTNGIHPFRRHPN